MTAACRADVEAALACAPIVERSEQLKRSGVVAQRPAHNDTKLNNVLLDDTSGEGLCVIDLDTVMPGNALTDFGDFARSAATRAAEDERDLARVTVDAELFAALARGFVRGADASLSAEERAELPFAARLMCFLIGSRFLADHLRGDTYFRVQRPGHNLERARTQLALVSDYERKHRPICACPHGAEGFGSPAVARLGPPKPQDHYPII